LGLGNSNKLLARFLNESLKHLAQISKMESGGLRNAIPREGYFIIAVPQTELDKAIPDLESEKTDVITEFKYIEPNISIEISKTNHLKEVASFEETKKLAQALMSAYNGVYRMRPDMEGVTETSNNVANVVVDNGEMKILCLSRSAIESGKKAMI